MTKTINKKAKIIYKIEFDNYVDMEFEGLLFDIENISEQATPIFREVLEPEYKKNGILLEDVKLLRFLEYDSPIPKDDKVKIKVKSLELMVVIDPQGKEVKIEDITIKDEDIVTAGITGIIYLSLITATALFGWLAVREIRFTVKEVKYLEPEQIDFLNQLTARGSIMFLLAAFIIWLIFKFFNKGGDTN